MRMHVFCAIAGCVLVAAACAEAAPVGDTTTTLSAATSTTIRLSQTTEPAGTTTSAPPTTTHAPAQAMPELLVVGPEGVFLVEPGADPVQLVEGRAATAVDDGLGGLLYQIDAGRDWEQTEEPRTTIVWWVPAGSERPLDLLVPASDQDLTLEDAYAVDGSLTVLYRRSEGAVSFEMVDSLRSYDRATGSVTELMRGSAWEAGFDIGSVGGGLIAGTSYTQVDASCFFLNLDGEVVSSPANPSVPGCEDPDCPRYCTLSPDGGRLAHLEMRFDESTNTPLAYEAVVDDSEAGAEVARIEIPYPEWGVSGFDVFGDWLIVNRTVGGEQGRAWLLSSGATDVPAWELPIAGVARFVTAPVTVRPAPLVLRGDGLGVVTLGQPMASAMPLLETRFGTPTSEWTYTRGAGDDPDHGCFAATGYSCEAVFRSVWWEELGLSVIFSDGEVYRTDGVAHLTYWSSSDAGDTGLATETGIAVGATVDALRAAYGDRLVPTQDGCGDEVPALRTDAAMPIHVSLSGPPEDPATTVAVLWAGNGGSC